ncbi:hypothetical protein PR003_g1782 [Phytophthora rubi]|uniref:Uncharacterized protein n=1 Tax=Phytophthora rubi TaxID=129364 RepID=A0A6A4G3M3_9STRA|nr:hypothetical protein PR003_g1782 [Phytophthora rubi]
MLVSPKPGNSSRFSKGHCFVKQLGVRPGPQLKELLDRVMAWQHSNSERTRDECTNHFKAVVAAETSQDHNWRSELSKQSEKIYL